MTFYLCEVVHFYCEMVAGARIFRGIRVFCYTGLITIH